MKKRLFHLSRTKGLTVLEPRTPEFRMKGEKPEAVVCVAASWEICSSLLSHITEGLLYVYEVDEEDLPLFEKAETGAWDDYLEYRSYTPVRVHGVHVNVWRVIDFTTYETGEVNTDTIDLSTDARYFTRPCTCGSGLGWGACGTTEYCG
jgi:hypothetical protein